MTSPKAPPRTVSTVRRTFLIGVAVVSFLGFLALWWLFGVLASSRLRKAEETADRLDPGWRMEELLAARPTMPDEKNSALEVLAALRNLPGPWPSVPQATVRWGPVPHGGKDVLARIESLPPGERLDFWLTEELRDELGRVPAALAHARRLADMNYGRYELKIEKNVSATLLPHALNSRSVARLLKADALLRAQDGDLSGAIDSCRAMIQCGRALADEPFWISQVVRVAIVGEAISTLQRILALGEVPEDSLAKIQSLLVQEWSHPFLLTAVRGERALMNDHFNMLRSGEATLATLAGSDLGVASAIPMIPDYLKYNHALMLEAMNEAVAIAKRPDGDQIDAWVQWEILARGNPNPIARATETLKHLFIPAMSALGQAHLRFQGQLTNAIAMVAAERERRAGRGLPTDPSFLRRNPETSRLKDPFTGEPLRFKTDPTGLTIYVVGYDRKDDGGKFHPRNQLQFGYDDGLKLVAPALRGLPPREELPRDVFQQTGPDPTEGPP